MIRFTRSLRISLFLSANNYQLCSSKWLLYDVPRVVRDVGNLNFLTMHGITHRKTQTQICLYLLLNLKTVIVNCLEESGRIWLEQAREYKNQRTQWK